MSLKVNRQSATLPQLLHVYWSKLSGCPGGVSTMKSTYDYVNSHLSCLLRSYTCCHVNLLRSRYDLCVLSLMRSCHIGQIIPNLLTHLPEIFVYM